MNSSTPISSKSIEFQNAIENGDFDTVYQLIRNGKFSVHGRDSNLLPNGELASAYAAFWGHSDIAFWLTSQDAFSDLELELIQQIEAGNLKRVQEIAETGVIDFKQRTWPSDESDMPLGIAIKGRNQKMVKLLISFGCPADALALDLAIQVSNLNLIETLIELGADVNGLNMGRQPVLFSAARTGNLEITKKLIELEADIDLQDAGEQTAIDIAIDNDHQVVARYLI